ncbi:MAG: hypothetical protein Q9O24_13290 [Gammaproteobacteria bacterium]|nr:hypothetical protein [Gammaproteobacteria bacterium]
MLDRVGVGANSIFALFIYGDVIEARAEMDSAPTVVMFQCLGWLQQVQCPSVIGTLRS